MFRELSQIRVGERRPTVAAFATLLTFTAAHAMLETARDALFLARVAVARLPWVYLAIAAISLALALFADKRAGRTTGYTVSGWLLFSAGSTLGLWFLISTAGTWIVYALYIWSGVIATFVVTRFSVLLSHQFTLTQAKRLYGIIGAGSVLGAILGSGLASLLTRLAHPSYLLTTAATLFVVSAAGPIIVDRKRRPTGSSSDEPDTLSPKLLWDSKYARRIGILVLCSTVALTFADYIFKSAVAEHVSHDRLGNFFSTAYLCFNVVSLIVQLALVQPLIRVAGVSGSLIALPTLMLGGALGMLWSGGLLMGLVLKGADGSLRYSLHRTVVELLFVPMSDRLRNSAKTLIDVIGQRGGQALASMGILAAIALGAKNATFSLILLVVLGLWIAIAYDLRTHYLDLFRQTLRESAGHPRLRFPSLDLSSLESVIAALNSMNDAEVRAALHILAEDGRSRLIPALILYHPSPEVVIDALDILDRAGRRDFVPITERLLERGIPEVRAAVLRVRNAHDIDARLLRKLVEQDCPIVRATALVLLIRAQVASNEELELLQQMVDTGSPNAKIALAQAISHKPAAIFEDALVKLAQDSELAVTKAALAAMVASPTARYLPTLMPMLARRELRSEARRTLVALDETALSFLAGALVDERRPLGQRRHVPRTIMRFGGSRAASLLLEQLPIESDGVVRYKILRALSQMRRDDKTLVLDKDILDIAITKTIARAYQLIEWRLALKTGAETAPERKTEAQSLLLRMLYDKEVHAVERLFLLLGLKFADEDLATIFRAIQSANPNVRSSSRELLENLLAPPLRETILGLIDEGPEPERLAQGGISNSALPYERVLQELLEARSPALKSLTVYHVAELGLRSLRPRIEQLTEPEQGLLSGVARAAVDWLSDLPTSKLAVEGG